MKSFTGWPAKTVATYVKRTFSIKIQLDTARNYLHLFGFSHRKPSKKLVKADTTKQEEFARNPEELESNHLLRCVTVYVDEGKI